ncbi:YhcN/YlaJ family sporulation lipoprotein [Cohnella thailandensis]|uniref:Sporulation protein n=1 Tax=Cohnella thailandensis TaxID=557557 RepID=A0A841SSB2_9BACL|nr:YhcN/YlaJ family sporulation lipoprotein [Cohnella thailandensis]MBB6632955.1 hypothetical protein [Cohnella thailandensis]MBP1975352.1 hypothetical protein [Cohnella thailandensis]
MSTHRSIRRIAATAALSIAIIGVQAGCTNNNNNNANGSSSIKTQNYGNDGYLGRTNSYPRIPGRHMALSYKNDARLIQQSIRDVPGVAGSSVTFNGADAYVTIKLDRGVAQREVATVERQAASVLRFNFPRYTIHVTSAR